MKRITFFQPASIAAFIDAPASGRNGPGAWGCSIT